MEEMAAIFKNILMYSQFNMDSSVVSTIEKIKLLEQDTDNKLKEKREYDAHVSNLKRAIKETLEHADKQRNENINLESKIDHLKSELDIANTQKTALSEQVQAYRKEMSDLQSTLDCGISKVWEIRSSLCTAIQSVADSCDVRALLIKPVCLEPVASKIKKNDQDIGSKLIPSYDDRIKTAMERRERALLERERLQVEPDEGEEFVRIRNALQFSMDMVSKLSK